MQKRLLSLILLLILTLSVFPTVSRAESAVLTELTYDLLSHEARGCISDDLNLPTEIGGVSVSWKSSDTSVISDTGIVTRPESEPAEVTLTATADGESKDFVFTVMPELYYVNYSDSFAYSENEGSVITKLLGDWTTRWGVSDYPSSKFAIETLSDGSTNCYIRNDMWKDRPLYILNGIKPSGKIKVSYRVNMEIPDDTDTIFDYKLSFSSDSFVRMRFYFNADNTGKVVFGDNTKEIISAADFGGYNLKGRWVNLDWILDTDNKKLWFYIDGELVTGADGITSSKVAQPLQSVDFELGLSSLYTVLSIDDISVVTMCDNQEERDVIEAYELLSLENFSPQSKFAVTENLDFSNVSIEGCEGVNITYESGSENLVIEDNTGKIIRAEEDAKALLYATITNDGTNLSMTKTFEFTVKGLKYEVYDSESFYYPELAGEKVTDENGGWELQKETAQEGYLDSMYVKERGNSSVKSFREISDESGSADDMNYFCYYFDDNISKRDVILEARIKTGKLESTDDKIYVVNLCGKYGTSSKVRTYTEMHFYVSSSSKVRMDAKWYNPLKGDNQYTTVARDIAAPDEWFDFKMKIDMFDKTFSIYINGECVTPDPLNFQKNDGVDINAEAAGPVYFCANPFRTMAECELYIDDFTTYSTKGEYAELLVYKNGEKTRDLGYLSPSDSLSADVQLCSYPEEKNGTVNVIAAVYSGKKLHDAAVVKGEMESGMLRVNFPSLDIPDTVEDMQLKIFCVNLEEGAFYPVCEETLSAHKLNGSITPVEHTDSATGRSYYTIDLNGENALRCYYTMPIWSKDSKKFYFYDEQYRMYEFEVETGKYRYIATLYSASLVMTSKMGNVFYVDKSTEIIRMTPEGEKEVVGTLPTEINVIGATLLQVNNDESYLSMELTEKAATTTEFDTSKAKRITVMNIETGEWDLEHIHGFDTVSYVPNHINMNPNPEYSHLVAFAHEGRGSDCQGNPERIWLLDRETGEFSNLYKQKMSYGNVPAETVSHEAWMQSGELMMFANSSKKLPGGITLFKTDGSDRRYVNIDYDYLHASGSTVTDRFVVSDTAYGGKTTKLVFIDCYTGKSYLLATLPQSGVNPGHTHPNFSSDGKKVIFGLYSEDLTTIRIGWMDISDIIENVADGEEITLSETCSTTSYGDTDFFLERTTVSGEEFYNIAYGKHMNVNITAFEKETADVTITFDYIDKGTDDIVIDYVRWETVNGKNKIVDYQETISRTNTGGVKPASVTLSGINAENLKLMGTDFTVKGAETDLAVKNIIVTEN